MTELELDELGPRGSKSRSPRIKGGCSRPPAWYARCRRRMSPAAGSSARRESRCGPDRRRRRPDQAEGRDRAAALPARLLLARRRVAGNQSVDVGEAPDLVPAIAAGALAAGIAGDPPRAAARIRDRTRRVPRYCAAGCWKARSWPGIMGCHCRWRSGTTNSPSISPRIRSCARPASGCCWCPGWRRSPRGCCGGCCAISRTSLDCPWRSRARMAADPDQRPLPRGAAPGGTGAARDLGGARRRSRGSQRVPARHAPAVRGLRHGRATRGDRGPARGQGRRAVTTSHWTRPGVFC